MKHYFNFRFVFVLTAIILSLLLLIESTCYYTLPPTERTHGFFIRLDMPFIKQLISSFNYHHSDDLYPGDVRLVGFNQVDPLLGYSMPEKEIHAMGYETEHHSIVLRSPLKNKSRVKIFITGGSTTDIALNHQNWPKHLSRLLEQQGICADLYVGAVGGYNSGQELLKLIRDGLKIQPDIYISYSGANETSPQSYTHEYEYDLQNQMIQKTNTGTFLPNTVLAVKKKLGLQPLTLLEQTHQVDSSFWYTNMSSMHALAVENKAAFIGILQPVLGSGRHVQPLEMERWKGDVAWFRQFYPVLQTSIQQHPDYLYDLSGVFDSIHEKVFVDDCHLTDTYQPFMAQKIFTLLRERKML